VARRETSVPDRCSYGGIYRTDRYGNYNVPFSGDRSLDGLLANHRLEVASAALKRLDRSETSSISSQGVRPEASCSVTLRIRFQFGGQFSPLLSSSV